MRQLAPELLEIDLISPEVKIRWPQFLTDLQEIIRFSARVLNILCFAVFSASISDTSGKAGYSGKLDRRILFLRKRHPEKEQSLKKRKKLRNVWKTQTRLEQGPILQTFSRRAAGG